MGQRQFTVVSTADGTTGSTDVSSEIPEPADRRQSNTPLIQATHVDVSAGSASDETANVSFDGDRSLDIGPTLDSGDQLVVTYEPRDEGNVVG